MLAAMQGLSDLKKIFFKHSLGQILGHHCCLEVAAVNLLFLALHRPSFVRFVQSFRKAEYLGSQFFCYIDQTYSLGRSIRYMLPEFCLPSSMI